jgi:WXG100 family type VII secretion target
MQLTATEFANSGSRLDQYVDTLRVNLLGLEGTWTGTASNAFSTAMAGWYSQFARIRGHMNTMQQLLSTGASNYEDAERNNLAQSNSLTVPTGGLFKV